MISATAERDRGRISTFYSYKGGTGRSMLLANVAWALATTGRRVLMVDWDLEAPGLHRYFSPFLIDPELTDSEGLIDLVIDYASAAVEPAPEREAQWYHEYTDIRRYAVSVNWQFPRGGSLTLVPAGRQGGTYATRTNTFNWQHFYEKLGGYGFMEAVKQDMARNFGEVLIDSRTGVSDTSGISTVQMPDQLIACFTLNNQSIEGTAAVARSVLAQRPAQFRIYPVATRIDNSEVDRLRERWALARSRFMDIQRNGSDDEWAEYWDAVQVPYIPTFSYEEVLADVANRPDDPKNINLFAYVQAVTERVFGVKATASHFPSELRHTILSVYAGSQRKEHINEVASEASIVEQRIEAEVQQQVAAQKETVDALRRQLDIKRARGAAHAFVLVPYGVRTVTDGERIDFDRIYDELIVPALQEAGLDSVRPSGDHRRETIDVNMLQELVLAELVVVDSTLENATIWYQLGVRHALRARGVLTVSRQGASAPDLFMNQRRLLYTLKDGAPDPNRVAEDKRRLAEMISQMMDVGDGPKVSPIYQLLSNLQEPDWRSLRIADAREFWEPYDAWQMQIEMARKTRRIANLLVLADEPPIAAFRVDARIMAGKTLRRAGQYGFALEHLENALELKPNNLDLLRETGICLQRLALSNKPGFTLERARQHYRDALATYPLDAETWALLGRVDKDAWTQAWNHSDRPEEMREEAAYEDALLRGAIDSYSSAYRTNPGHYYSGINALTLMHLYRDLTGNNRYDAAMETMTGAVRFAADCESEPYLVFWAKATLAELEVLVGTPTTVTTAYKVAVAKNENDWFALNSSRDQLLLLKRLRFRVDHVEAGIAVLDRALGRLQRPTEHWQPEQVILFSGQTVDAQDFPEPRFPANRIDAAALAIAQELDRLNAGPSDLALCQAAAGGDLLFIEACQKRGVRCQVLLPFPEPEYIQRYVMVSAEGDTWRKRYLQMKDQLQQPMLVMSDELGPSAWKVDSSERWNLWLLYMALTAGLEKLHFLCLWDGRNTEEPSGIGYLYEQIQRRAGRITWIDVRRL